MHNLSYENEFDLHGNEPVSGGTHFRMNGFARRLVLTKRQNATLKWLMVDTSDSDVLPDLGFTAHALLNGQDTAVNKDGRDNGGSLSQTASWTEKVVVTISQR